MFELNYDLAGIDAKTFYGVNNQYFNLLKSSFPTLKITGRDHYVFAMGNQQALDVLKQKLDDIVNYISKDNSITLKDVIEDTRFLMQKDGAMQLLGSKHLYQPCSMDILKELTT